MDRFTINNDNTVTDSQTGLIWHRPTLARDVDHEDALAKVAELGEGWRLPTLQELFSIADHSRHSPAIDTEAFPETDNDWYWTSTECSFRAAARWVVVFSYGLVYSHGRSYLACVRAVRAGQ